MKCRMLAAFSLMMCLIYSLSSCNAVVEKMYGFKNIDKLNTDTLLTTINKNEVLRKEENYYVDSTYMNGVYAALRNDTLYAKHLYQPIQALYFDTMGHLISYHINCNAGGFPNLNWNRNHVFQTYPPATQTPCSDQITYGLIGPYFNELTGTGLVSKKREKVVIFWSAMLYKQSENLITLVMKNLKDNNKESTVELQFVNTDYLYRN